MSVSPDEQLVEIACEYFPAQVRRDYAELLHQQAQGEASGAKDICRRIAEQLATRKVTPRLALKLHLSTLEEVIEVMGPSSAKRVLCCADVLVLELMSALADAYRQLPSPAPAPMARRKTWFSSGVN